MKNPEKRANFITFAIIGAIIVIGIGLLFFLNGANEEEGVNAVTADELQQQLDQDGEVVAYFWQTGCEYCEQVKPYVEPLIEEYDAVSINLADHNVWETYGINGTPTIIRFEDGKEVGRIEGAVSEQQYETFFKNEEAKEE
ncbi:MULTISPECIES: thioredoxin family protein [Exiguobacterium]|jgi:thioredoxin-like negative regulator of GroEL|uniref:thioredoxin family protein n=1 Tax=Exiguobacterium TaxID=33986 RepID=UPI001BE96359|nr:MULTISPECIES: thioredoxin family protein [Exiguobacterium]MCA0979575.1 thioredoxin family protein [Exiguobacterium aestuarii]MDA5560431.1 thioredoxin family protein [Exiguobacterium sp. MMG028]MDE0562148.1 thioredoxin family protein [Exiguobacterium sp. B2(2022)]